MTWPSLGGSNLNLHNRELDFHGCVGILVDLQIRTLGHEASRKIAGKRDEPCRKLQPLGGSTVGNCWSYTIHRGAQKGNYTSSMKPSGLSPHTLRHKEQPTAFCELLCNLVNLPLAEKAKANTPRILYSSPTRLHHDHSDKYRPSSHKCIHQERLIRSYLHRNPHLRKFAEKKKELAHSSSLAPAKATHPSVHLKISLPLTISFHLLSAPYQGGLRKNRLHTQREPG